MAPEADATFAEDATLLENVQPPTDTDAVVAATAEVLEAEAIAISAEEDTLLANVPTEEARAIDRDLDRDHDRHALTTDTAQDQDRDQGTVPDTDRARERVAIFAETLAISRRNAPKKLMIAIPAEAGTKQCLKPRRLCRCVETGVQSKTPLSSLRTKSKYKT